MNKKNNNNIEHTQNVEVHNLDVDNAEKDISENAVGGVQKMEEPPNNVSTDEFDKQMTQKEKKSKLLINNEDENNANNVVEHNQDVNENDYMDELKEEDDSPLMEDDNLNLGVLGRIIRKCWWMILLNCIIFGAIAALLIVEEPRTYTSEIKLAPESEELPTGGSLTSIASSFGVDLGTMASSDAIRPDLYPDLVQSSDFIYKLFKLPVRTIDGNIYTDYYTYLLKYQKSSWWGKGLRDFKKKLQPQPQERKYVKTGNNDFNIDKTSIKYLSSDEEMMIEKIKGLINCNIDQKTFIISISVTDQDPLVAATVADSVRERIQTFITEYRTKKATKDYLYYISLLKQAKIEYENSVQAYANYVDTHRDVILQAYISERDQLENDMQLKLNTYNAMITQTQQAKAKVQENTPAFTILQNAFVPVKPTGPKRMLFVIGIVFLTLFMTVVVVVLKELFKK